MHTTPYLLYMPINSTANTLTSRSSRASTFVSAYREDVRGDCDQFRKGSQNVLCHPPVYSGELIVVRTGAKLFFHRACRRAWDFLPQDLFCPRLQTCEAVIMKVKYRKRKGDNKATVWVRHTRISIPEGPTVVQYMTINTYSRLMS